MGGDQHGAVLIIILIDAELFNKIAKILAVIIRQVEVEAVAINNAEKVAVIGHPHIGAVNRAKTVMISTPMAAVRAGVTVKLTEIKPLRKGIFIVLSSMRVHLRYY